MSATERSVVRSIAAARSSRRVSRYACGVSPNARRNSRLKCARESPAARARSSTSSRSAKRASARSLALRRWRAGGTKAMAREYVADMAYGAHEARQELLDDIAAAIERLAAALADLGVAYEQLDEHSADRLEAALFRPVQTAYGRA